MERRSPNVVVVPLGDGEQKNGMVVVQPVMMRSERNDLKHRLEGRGAEVYCQSGETDGTMVAPVVLKFMNIAIAPI